MESTPNHIESICVFCGSRPGDSEVFTEVTKKLGEEMNRRKYGLVYGGGNVGLMGTISETIHNGGGRVQGIIPHGLAPKEISGTSMGEVVYVEDMHSRKKIMYERSDAFIALPGGIGTFEELFETLTWIQLGIHSKPVGILNIDGYYTHLQALLETSAKRGFIDQKFINSIVFSDDPIDLLNKLETTKPPSSLFKWIKTSQI
ncbi:Conserved hypothetical protein [Heterostelium album PN500]|uniref:Cytokinin riboside 5'-monophosphate phosphoribohydrolase n=1 Tax=Heterostelium pallidum (strain ATCC 26659 / Pp 5 / PN500) TaxID=670386 RepID=D3B496_HETP5|nr:Conserved hypothetical protein [Heterostelium album PN500]EFA84144.1 Conserved hypothetical protein [Heterostelium album PN500]|eukprot:XP_020436261.1 Conserved hypothetical protein [Heterostelium album PN500]